jgi:ribosomal protein S18 acetylase RimI-like enzyme
MTIAPASLTDIPLIQALIQQIWVPTYKEILSQTQMDYMLNLMYSNATLEQQMQSGQHFLIAYNMHTPIGFVGFEFDYEKPQCCKIHKLYFLPQQQGMGFGRIMLEKVITLARNENQKAIILNVNRHNKAFQFYIRQGFTIKETVDIAIGSGYYMNDYILELNIA